MTIRTQLIILVLVPLLCGLAAVGGGAYLQRITQLTTDATTQTAPLVSELTDFIQFLQEPAPGSGKPARYHLQAARNRISSLTVNLKPYFSTAEEQKLIKQLHDGPQRLTKQLDQTTRGSSTLSSRGAALLAQEIKGMFPIIDQLHSHYSRTLQSRTQQITTLNQILLLTATVWPLLFR